MVSDHRAVTELKEAADVSDNLELLVAERTSQLETLNESQSQEIDARKIIESEYRQSLKREKLTKHLIQLMQRSFQPDIILEAGVREIGTFFGADRTLVVLYEEVEGANKLRLAAQYCHSEKITPVEKEAIPDEIKLKNQMNAKHPLIFLTASEPAQFPKTIRAHLLEQGVKAAFIIEIKYRSIPFGRLVLHQCTQNREWLGQEVSFLEILATHIGAALYQAKLFQDQKQAMQAAEEATRLKSKVMSFVAHDFKNPLAAMGRFIEMLERDPELSDKHRELVGYVGEGTTVLRNMILDILDRARLAEGKIQPDLKWFGLKTFLAQLHPTFLEMASQKNKNIEVNVSIEPEGMAINADPTLLRQVLINLISNAVKYNRAGGKIFLTAGKSPDGKFSVLAVRDTGLGIPEEKLPKIFAEFFRVDLSEVNPVEGTGLGLAFIQKLVELHGGHITVESELGTGSTFTVFLPLPELTN